MKQVKISINHCIAIIAIVALIGILFVPAVSAGKTINYMPCQRTIKSLSEVQNPSLMSPVSFPQQKYFPVIPGLTNQTVQPDGSTPIVFPPTPSVPSTGIPIQPFRKYSAIAFPFIQPRITPALINPPADPGATIQPDSAPTNSGTDPLYISKDEAIRIAKESISNISLTSDPVATLTSQRVTNEIRSIGFELKIPVWVVELSGVSTDPHALGVRQWYNSNTGEIIDVPIHANRWVIIDAITGKVIRVDSCF